MQISREHKPAHLHNKHEQVAAAPQPPLIATLQIGLI